MNEQPLLKDLEIKQLEDEIKRLQDVNMSLVDGCVKSTSKDIEIEKLNKDNKELFDLCIKMHDAISHYLDSATGASPEIINVYDEALEFFGV